jgi:hypothetical protein
MRIASIMTWCGTVVFFFFLVGESDVVGMLVGRRSGRWTRQDLPTSGPGVKDHPCAGDG